MPSLRNVLGSNVFPVIRRMEENPEVSIIKENVTQTRVSSPYSSSGYRPTVRSKLDRTTVPCIYSEDSENIQIDGEILSRKRTVFYIKEVDYDRPILLSDIFVYPPENGIEYKPTSVENIFGLWKVGVEKASI